MLQARMKGAKEWYRPDRDFLIMYPRLLSRALSEAAKTVEEDDVEMTELNELAADLAKVVNACAERTTSAEELQNQLGLIYTKHESLYKFVAVHMMEMAFETYRAWKLETLPDKPDGTVDHAKLTPPTEPPKP